MDKIVPEFYTVMDDNGRMFQGSTVKLYDIIGAAHRLCRELRKGGVPCDVYKVRFTDLEKFETPPAKPRPKTRNQMSWTERQEYDERQTLKRLQQKYKA